VARTLVRHPWRVLAGAALDMGSGLRESRRLVGTHQLDRVQPATGRIIGETEGNRQVTYPGIPVRTLIKSRT
jgi:hypothetical protein